MPWFFVFFIGSGFSALVYQVVWLRLCMADFGVTTPMVSIVLSVFMAGLALGSVGGGRLARLLEKRSADLPLRFYGLAEVLIGSSALLVPVLLALGRSSIAGAGSEWGSGSHYLVAGGLVTLALLPACVLMGTTFPLAMGSIRRRHPDASPRSFSFLYVANVLGAMAGATGSAFVLIELLGFRRTQYVAVAVNGCVGFLALLLSARSGGRVAAPEAPLTTPEPATGRAGLPSVEIALVFLSGFAALALEVVWTRIFTPFLGVVVYGFATMLAVYLLATTAGTLVYRSRLLDRGRKVPWPIVAVLAGVSVCGGIVATDPQFVPVRGLTGGAIRLGAGIGPFCLLLGYLTPMLLDRISRGDPARAGAVYAVNMVGCILGPLVAGFALVPWLGERAAIYLLGLPILALGLWAALLPSMRTGLRPPMRVVLVPAAAILTAGSLFVSSKARDYIRREPGAIVRRDYTATVVASGSGPDRRLLVNGFSMTRLTPVTKMMTHLPLAHLGHPARRGLVLCLGMGTSFRSMLSWGIDSTVVELVPSIPGLLDYYHSDGAAIRTSPLAHIVVDDARRFLERTRESYDVIVIDPPPPVEAAGASLLYSREFLAVVRTRLAPGGILQHWLPRGDPTTVASVARALDESFPHIRVMKSLQGWGWHFLASESPIARLDGATLAARLPVRATADILEWGPKETAAMMFESSLSRELPIDELLSLSDVPALTDDHPRNEYYHLRRRGREAPTLR